jgi:hypothetical protein
VGDRPKDKKGGKRGKPARGAKSVDEAPTNPPGQEDERRALTSPAGTAPKTDRDFVEQITDDLASDAADALALIRPPTNPSASVSGISLQDIGLPIRTRQTTQKVDLTGFQDAGADTFDLDEEDEGEIELEEPMRSAGDDEDTLIDQVKRLRYRIPRGDTQLDDPTNDDGEDDEDGEDDA